ncbi:MAG: hypothetical protein NWF06_03775 [Candidatus Bathyarchaeota archaeon]|nr:hypothetical protein [Candidatus Bathyarchaeum sp.]
MNEETNTTQSGVYTVNVLRGSEAEVSAQIASLLGTRRLNTELHCLGTLWDATNNEIVAILVYTT